MLCKTYDESLQKQWIYSVFFALSIVVTQLKHQKTSNLQYILEFLEKNEIWRCFPQNGRFQDQTGGQETTSQNRRVGMYVGVTNRTFLGHEVLVNDTGN